MPRRVSRVFGLPIVLGGAPVRFDQPVELHVVKRRVERALLDAQHRFRDLPDASCHREAVTRSGCKGAQDEKGERSLKQFSAWRLSHRCST